MDAHPDPQERPPAAPDGSGATPPATPEGSGATPATAPDGSGATPSQAPDEPTNPPPAQPVQPAQQHPAPPPQPASPTPGPGLPPDPSLPSGPYQAWPPPVPPLPPRQPGYFQTGWKGPAAPGGPAVPLAVLVGALAFAVFVPLNHTGVGWALAGLVSGGIVAYLARSGSADRHIRLARAAWGAMSLALLSVLAFRNAWWLVTFCVLGALGCATLAVVTGRGTRSILFGLVAVPVAALRGLPWLRRHAAAVVGDHRRRAVLRVGMSVVVTLAMLAVFGGLLASADAAFAEPVRRMVPEADAGSAVRGVFLFAAGALAVTAAAYLVAAPPDLSTMDSPGRERLGRVEWALPIGALVLLFAGFVVVQVAVLFGGRRHVLRTAGLTYAEFARSGFWQLLAVTVLTLLVVAATTRWARRGSPGDRLLLRIAFGLLCGLSIVIVASALFRMYTYQQAYSFTGERIFVMAFELLLGSVFVMVLLAGVRLNGRWIPATTIALTAVMLLGLAVLNPEGYAAQRNVARYQATGKVDLWYLRALSADATPALAALPQSMHGCALSWITEDLRESDPWYAWNLGRQRARDVLHRLGDRPPGTCKGASRYDYGN